MFSSYDPRWGKIQLADIERPDISRGSRGPTDGRERPAADPRDLFPERLELPRGDARERVSCRDRVYEIRGAESRMLATGGAFRVVPAGDLRDHAGRPADPRERDLRHLREAGLVRTIREHGRRDAVVVLTAEGRDLLSPTDPGRRPRTVASASMPACVSRASSSTTPSAIAPTSRPPSGSRPVSAAPRASSSTPS